MQLIEFGGVRLPTIDEDVAFPWEARSSTIALPYGGVDEDGQPAISVPYVIERTFKIACTDNNNDLQTQTDELMQAFASGEKILKRRERDGSYRQTFAKVTRVSRPRRSDDRKYQEFTVTWAIIYPYWMPTSEEPHHMDHGLLMDTGLFMDGQYTAVTLSAGFGTTMSINVTGIVPFQRGYMVIYPQAGTPNGSITNLTIRNLANQMYFQYIGTIAYPAYAVIDFLTKSCKVDALNMYTAISIPFGQMDWMQLEIGLNAIEIEVTARLGAVLFEWHWANHYL